MRPSYRVLTAALSLALTAPCLAQYSVEKLDIRGGAPYTDAEIATVSGLQAGQMLSHDSLANAAQHLIDTGLFDDAQVSLAGTGKARIALVELKPTPLLKLLPISFDNLIWFTPAELEQGIHQRIPLYRSVASDAGNLPDSVDLSLQQMLAAKTVNASVTHAIVEPTNAFPRRHVAFSVDSPSIRLGTISLTGGSTVGYTAHITEGAVYKISAITSDAPLPPDAPLPGDPASAKSLQRTQARLLEPILTVGFLDAYIETVPTLDPTAHTVAYSLHTVRGDQYRLKSVTPLNLSAAAQAEFNRGWLLKPGDVYNPIYVARFIQNNTALRALATYTASFQAVSDPQTHLTDLTITFIPGPRH